MEQVKIHVEVEINPTESTEKVQAAIGTILEGTKVEVREARKGAVLIATAEGHEKLIKLRKALRNDRIRDAARKQLLRAIRGNTVSFCLNKQVAFAGHISFCEETAESPLGPIKILIESDNPTQLVEWLAQKT
ncbi:MAG: hypothetical protein NWF01_10350 [Candidatus Bathyarchaeota archaeon]|nr:hypothetical protein [Candidatus Bathyarchaeota archaeon]